MLPGRRNRRIEASVRTRVTLTRKKTEVVAGIVPTQIGMRNGWVPAADTVTAGRGLSFMGRFDGDPSNTRVLIGGEEVRIVAESTISVSIYTSAGTVGHLSVTIVEDGVEHLTSFRNLGLELSIDQAELRRGQRTTAHFRVTGLAGITTPATLAVVNATPGIITLAPRNAQVFTITPAQVDASGAFQVDRGVTGVTPGDFIIGALALSR